MRKFFSIKQSILVGLYCLAITSLGASAVSPKRVLILNPFGRDTEPFTAVVSAFCSTLGKEIREPVAFDEVPLDLAHFTEAEGEEPLVTFLAERIKRQPVDLVVPVGSASVRFIDRHRQRLFPGVPILAVAAEPRMIPPGFLENNATLITQKIDLPGMIEDMLRLQPDTRKIAVVFGSSLIEKLWAAECKREFQRYASRVEFIWLNDLPFEEVLARCATLPPHSLIFQGLFLEDALGIPFEKNEGLRRLHEKANAPVFTCFASEFGLGPVGGRLFQNSGIGAQAAGTALRILQGERADSIPPEILAPATPVYDWRELRRWKIPQANLPPGSIIHFRQLSFWERYHWLAIGVIAFGILQAALIVGLLVNRKCRLQSEAEATLIAEISSKFVNLPAHEVDREIMAAQRRICETLDLGISALWQWSAAETGFLTLTHIYQADGGPKPPDRMDAEEFFPWHRQHMAAGRVSSFSSLDDLPPEAARDKESMRHFLIKSNLTLPLSVGGEPPIGALGFNATRKERVWSPELIKRLQMIAQIFTTALARKRADQALRESELRLSLAAESADAGMWVLDLATQLFWVTDKAREIFQFTPEESIHMDRFKQMIHPDDLSLIDTVISEAIRTGDPLDVEYRVRIADGSQRWVASRGRPIHRENGQPERLLGLSMDITARKQNEEKARIGEARLAAGFNLAGLGYYEFDFEKNTCFIDDRFHEICGIPAGHLVAAETLEHWMGRVFPADLELVTSENQKLHDATADRVSLHHRYVHPKDGVKWLHHFSGVSARAPDGTVLRTHGVIRDVTEQRNAESVTEELRTELSHSGRVTLLGQLASSLAHELSQPLGAILRNAEAAEIMLKESSPDTEELRAIIDDILRDDHRAGEVINKLRSLLKKGRLDLHPIDLPEVVTEVISLIHSDAASRNVELSLTTEPGIPTLRGDRIHLQQVLLNLIVNAMDALGTSLSDARVVNVHVGLPDLSTVEIRVTDNGPGITEDHLADLFDPFFTTKPTGMGMGLAVSKTIVEAHGGRIHATNLPEGGACFSITLPTVHHA